MSDPRINPNYRGIKCPGCGERLPTLLTEMCTYCTLEAKDAEIERLRAALQKIADWPDDEGADVIRGMLITAEAALGGDDVK